MVKSNCKGHMRTVSGRSDLVMLWKCMDGHSARDSHIAWDSPGPKCTRQTVLGRYEGEGLRHGFRDLRGVREEGSQYDQNILHRCLKCSQREQLKLTTHRKKALVCRLSVADLSQRLASII